MQRYDPTTREPSDNEANGAGRRIWPIGKAFCVDASWEDRFKRMATCASDRQRGGKPAASTYSCQGWKPNGQDRRRAWFTTARPEGDSGANPENLLVYLEAGKVARASVLIMF